MVSIYESSLTDAWFLSGFHLRAERLPPQRPSGTPQNSVARWGIPPIRQLHPVLQRARKTEAITFVLKLKWIKGVVWRHGLNLPRLYCLEVWYSFCHTNLRRWQCEMIYQSGWFGSEDIRYRFASLPRCFAKSDHVVVHSISSYVVVHFFRLASDG